MWIKSSAASGDDNVNWVNAADLLLQGLPHLLDARLLDEVGQLERRLLDSSLALQVLPLEAPVPRHRHRVPGGLEVDQQLRLLGRHVVHLHHVWTRHQLDGGGRGRRVRRRRGTECSAIRDGRYGL